ncbi:MAG: prolipoprotein diacylglyceryl transferase family protein [Acidobacteriota bacterium]
MIESLFSIGDFEISPFGPALVAAFFAAFWQFSRGLRQLGVGDEEDASEVLFAAGIFGILGAKVYYATLMVFREETLSVFLPNLLSRSGLVWYGGMIAGTLAALLVIWRRKMPRWRTLDAAAAGLALGYGVGRLGCFLVGDDYGKPTDLPWGVVFKHGLPPTNATFLRSTWDVDLPAGLAPNAWVAVHPTQLYETGLALIIWGIGLWLLSRSNTPGVPGLIVFALLAIERFSIEFLRLKDDRFFVGDTLTMAQMISLTLLVLLIGLLLSRRRGRPAEAM